MRSIIVLLAALVALASAPPAAAQRWDYRQSQDEMTGEMRIFTTSPLRAPKHSLGFPYQNLKAWLGVGCKAGSEWAYVGLTSTPILSNTETHSGYVTFSPRIRWDDRVETVDMIQEWGKQSLHFKDGKAAIWNMMTAKEVLLELEWYGSGQIYFSFPLANSEATIRKALTRCQAADYEQQYDIRQVQRLLKEAGFDPGPIDGLWGGSTASALSAFQSAVGLQSVSGLEPETLRRLGYQFPQSPQGGREQTDSLTSILRNVEILKTGRLPSGPQNHLSLSLQDQVSRCWTYTPGTDDGKNQKVEVSINLAPDGRLVGKPRVVNPALLDQDDRFRAAAESAVRAILKCSPYDLPVAQYSSWKEVTLTFTP